MKEKIIKVLKVTGVIFVCLIILIWSAISDYDKLTKRRVASQVKTFYYHKPEYEYMGGFLLGESLTAQGAWNVTYPTSVKIDCYKDEMKCELIQASLFSDTDMLDVDKEEFEVKEWNKNYVKAYDEGTQYKYELNINLGTEEITYTKHPLSKKGTFGQDLETSTFKLCCGWKVDMNIDRMKIEKANWFTHPLVKIIDKLFPQKEDTKIELL